MVAENDRLEVQVEAQATRANNAFDKLVGNLEKLEASLTYINMQVAKLGSVVAAAMSLRTH